MVDRRGLFERLSGQPDPARPNNGYFMFAAMPLNLSLLADSPIYNLPVPELNTVQILEERANELGVDIRRGHELTGFTQDDDGVTLTVDGPDGTYELRTRYVVGADSAHSPVRKAAGIGFRGVTYDRTTSRTAHATVPVEWLDPTTGALTVPGHGINLGWKLAAAINAAADVLDTYESERRPIADRTITYSQAQAALLSPCDDITDLRQLFGELLTNQTSCRPLPPSSPARTSATQPATAPTRSPVGSHPTSTCTRRTAQFASPSWPGRHGHC